MSSGPHIIQRVRFIDTSNVAASASFATTSASTTFNPADLSGITLSGGNLTATYASTTNAQVRSIAGRSTGKAHFEFTIGALTDVGFPVVGIASASHSFLNYPGQDSSASLGWSSDGGYWLGGAFATLGANWAIATGDVLAIEVDFDAMTMKFQNETKGSGWSSAKDISSLTGGPYYIVINLKTASDTLTLNAGGSAYTVSPTSGYGNY